MKQLIVRSTYSSVLIPTETSRDTIQRLIIGSYSHLGG